MKLQEEKLHYKSYDIKVIPENDLAKKYIKLEIKIPYDIEFLKSRYTLVISRLKKVPETIKEYMELNEVNEKELIDILNNKTINHE
ncbi:MAG: hypothetical protein GY849_02285 [Deltaproteobacteria bacterium]|nr:hypothetical protein [Deltaproteobacteria bacterium]